MMLAYIVASAMFVAAIISGRDEFGFAGIALWTVAYALDRIEAALAKRTTPPND